MRLCVRDIVCNKLQCSCLSSLYLLMLYVGHRHRREGIGKRSLQDKPPYK